MSERITNSEFLAVMDEAFKRGQELKFTPSGSSMLPMLDGADDTVTLGKKPDRLKKYDVAFYRRPSGQLVLHRVVKVCRDGTYTFCGDNQLVYEPGVKHEDILALMTAFSHDGKARGISDFSYRFYIHRMMTKKRLRKFLGRVYRKVFKRR